MHLIECVPNFSEGRRKEVIDEITSVIEETAGVWLLDQEADADHNRSVFTFVGDSKSIHAAVLATIGVAVRTIDLNKHSGTHPRMGAVDVIPFVPVHETSMAECISLSRIIGKEIAEDHGIPVYLYEESATRPDRKNLANIREGQFEGIREKIKTDENRAPDFGKRELHATAGCVAVGARMPLVAYNIYLNTGDVSVAKKIAKKIREKDGGLAGIKALGFFIETRKLAQVSMNICDYSKTSVYKVFGVVDELAKKSGTSILSSELVGLMPEEALKMGDPATLKLENFNPQNQVIEEVIKRKVGR